jgi:hypothetical protein
VLELVIAAWREITPIQPGAILTFTSGAWELLLCDGAGVRMRFVRQVDSRTDDREAIRVCIRSAANHVLSRALGHFGPAVQALRVEVPT